MCIPQQFSDVIRELDEQSGNVESVKTRLVSDYAIMNIRSSSGHEYFLKGLSPELKKNKQFMLELIKINKEAHAFAADEIKNDPELVKAALATFTFH